MNHDEDENVFTGNQAVVTELTRSSFMKSVPKGKNEGQTKYMALGHRAEKPFISSAMDILNDLSFANFEAAYAPGLVAADAEEDSGSFFFMRDTADGVYVVRGDEDDDVDAIPVECKCRGSPSTCVVEKERVDELCREKAFDNVNGGNSQVVEPVSGTHNVLVASLTVSTTEQLKLFHRCVPKIDERVQLLHHAATYGSQDCVFLIGDDTSLIAVYFFAFDKRILESYKRVCFGIYEDHLAWVYIPGSRVPTPPPGWLDAFEKSKALKYLKMDHNSFMTHVALWRAININVTGTRTKQVQSLTTLFPLPPIIRFDPSLVSFWNIFKTGGDTITDLLDRFQERLGQRSENNVTVARFLMYFAVTFHRGNQWCNVDMNFPYPTLAHCRNANNKRAAFEDSIDVLIEMLLGVVREYNSKELLEATACKKGVDNAKTPVPMMEPFSLMPQQEPKTSNHTREKRPSRSTRKQGTPVAPILPAPAIKSGQTPRTSTQKKVPTHEERCKNCLGIFLTRVDTIGTVEDDGKTTTATTTKKTDDRTRHNCDYCKKRTNYMCLGCRRFCCFSSPSETKSGKKHPKHFSVRTPILDRGTGMLRRQKKSGNMICETIVGEWTCYHALHRAAWERYTESNKHRILEAARGKRLKTIKEGKNEDGSESESESDDDDEKRQSGSESDDDSEEEDDANDRRNKKRRRYN